MGPADGSKRQEGANDGGKTPNPTGSEASRNETLAIAAIFARNSRCRTEIGFDRRTAKCAGDLYRRHVTGSTATAEPGDQGCEFVGKKLPRRHDLEPFSRTERASADKLFR